MLMTICIQTLGQNRLEFDGQASVIGNASPQNDLPLLLGGRYIPELDYLIPLDSVKTLDFEASVNISGSVLFHPFDSAQTDGTIRPYRLWTRITGKQFEVRLGLQKIDFGSATLLRPLQWFNQIDPRDPLQLTNGVYGALGRYYFLNNANIWLWVLYGNGKTRGFDAVKTHKTYPEFGGRIQYPVPKGELALSYHHRTADSRDLVTIPAYERIPEDRIGLDGKWDLGIGLWVEASYIRKSKDIGILTHQALLNTGVDYTFGLGSGLNLVVEHLVVSYDTQPFAFQNTYQITATIISYPIGFFDRLSSVLYYNWTAQDFSFFINYEHQFKRITGYLMAYYNPETLQGIQQNELINYFSGPGVRLMFVYDH
jgi:hypothetical protein